MILPRTILHAVLERMLSWTSSLNVQGTGGWYQRALLRGMGVHLSGPVAVAPGTSFLGCENLHLGSYVSIGAGSRIVSWAPVTIGDDFLASDLLNINSGTHDPVTLEPTSLPISIGKRVWCGTGVTICAGVDIGDDVIIGARSLVTKSLPSNCVAYGIPARPVRTLERPDGRVWSMWPERSASEYLERLPKWKRALHWLRARL